jgi:glutaminyl-peptide cyclotransferase
MMKKVLLSVILMMTRTTKMLSRKAYVFALFFCLLGHQGSYSKDQAGKLPTFKASVAYQFIEKQIGFGPRVPNTPAHRLCGEYLQHQLAELGGEVHVQRFQTQAFDGTQLKLQNIIASFNPKCPKRIVLAAHWDTRPFADKDLVNKGQPIDGANDGASGVGVLLTIAQVLGQNPLSGVGVDILLLDGEDYGAPHGTVASRHGKASDWCLGAQYWSRHPHSPHYTAAYGVLLDMVGAREATFYREQHSMYYAAGVVQKIWAMAQQLGHSGYFIPQNSQGYILDDHVFVNQLARIPMVNIVDHRPGRDRVFKAYHHTQDDNLQLIDPQTLQAVGETLLQVLYTESL